MLILLLVIGGGLLAAEAYAHRRQQQDAAAIQRVTQQLLAPTLTPPNLAPAPLPAPSLATPKLTTAVGADPTALAKQLAQAVRQLRQVELEADPLTRAAQELEEARAMQEAYQLKLRAAQHAIDQAGPAPVARAQTPGQRIANLIRHAEAEAAPGAPVADVLPTPVIIDAAPPSGQPLDD